jgi:hypothetical protein
VSGASALLRADRQIRVVVRAVHPCAFHNQQMDDETRFRVGISGSYGGFSVGDDQIG